MRFKIYYKEAEEIPIFLMTIGIPGSGKSTWLKNQKGYNIVSPDDIRRDITGNVSDVSQDAKVWSIAKKKVTNLLKSSKNTILDATNVDSQKRKEFLSNLPEVILKAKIFNVSPAEAKKRIKKDIKSGKDRSNVPDDIIDKMYEKFKNGIKTLEQQGFNIVK